MSKAIGPQLPNQGEISIILRIYDMILAGIACNQIAETFTKEGIPTSRKPRKPEKYSIGKWTATTVRKIAENPIYAGIAVTGREKKI